MLIEYIRPLDGRICHRKTRINANATEMMPFVTSSFADSKFYSNIIFQFIIQIGLGT